MRIDIHTHFVCVDFIKHLQGRDAYPNSVLEGGSYFTNCGPGFRTPVLPKVVDLEVKLRDVAEMNVDLSVLSHAVPGPEVLGGQEADYWASRINDHLAGLIADYPDQFLGWGSIGFGSAAASIAEVDRCVDQLGFKGMQIFSNVNQRTLDSPEFKPVFEHVARRGIPLNMHPAIPMNLAGMDSGSLATGLGFMFDTSLNTVRLIQSGLFDELPDLKLIVPHIGGIMPYLQGRLERVNEPALRVVTFQPELEHSFTHYLKMLYYDSVTYHPEALDYFYRLMGAEHLLFGSDHPFGQPYAMVAEMVEQLNCTPAEKEMIYHGNAKGLLGIGS